MSFGRTGFHAKTQLMKFVKNPENYQIRSAVAGIRIVKETQPTYSLKEKVGCV